MKRYLVDINIDFNIVQNGDVCEVLNYDRFVSFPYTFDCFVCQNSNYLNKLKFFISEYIISKSVLHCEGFEFEKKEHDFHYYKRIKTNKISFSWDYCSDWGKRFVMEYYSIMNCIPGALYERDVTKSDIDVIGYPDKIRDKNKINIHVTGEPFLNPDLDNYDYILSFAKREYKQWICYPYFCMILDGYGDKYKPLFSNSNYTDIPKEFCAFVHTNPRCQIRNKYFHYLSQYKHVKSYGKLFNNVGNIYNYVWFDDRQIELLRGHKFVLCFENVRDDNHYYITEKLLNAKLSGAVPIYWGTSKILEIFNKDAFLFLERNDEKGFVDLMNKIKLLDSNDDLYLQMRNQRLIDENKIEQFRSNWIRNNINLVKRDKL